MINIILWKWNAPYKFSYTADHVNICAAMIRRHSTIPTRIFCITDDAAGVDPTIITIPIWPSPMEIETTLKPNCYRRLKMFSKDFNKVLSSTGVDIPQGERAISIDIDAVITSNIDHILSDNRADFIGWRKQPSQTTYQGSLTSIKLCTMDYLYSDFKGAQSRAQAAHLVGSDQAWVSLKLNNTMPVFTPADHGVYSFRKDILPLIKRDLPLPANHSIIFFHGSPKPEDCPHIDFVQDNYCL